MKKDYGIIISRIADSEHWRDSYYKPIWESALKLYRFKLSETREGANVFVPYIFMMCETVKARIGESLFIQKLFAQALEIGLISPLYLVVKI